MHNTTDANFSTYFDTRFARQTVKILPGQYYVTGEDKLIVTVLGSCVAACIYDPYANIGGMNHFLLPSNVYVKSEDPAIAKYGEEAMYQLIETLVKHGAQRHLLVAKVFGGGQVLQGFTKNDVGAMNASFVEAYLANAGIPIQSRDLMDTYARKVYFFPATGDVFMKRIRDLNNDTILQRESDHQYELSQQFDSGVA
ncbi:chemoreceptor glutamine deamidase CheD [Salinimonas sediminis]|uniref:Probable chemoreceptor glutamine deamidase CheD n=1 Tax=Salinimonas sediminis TaxID=2303538 RepID=A0A346NRB5_9ALTE|nr:chemoreceptor glutamine deamidase CheD [Salinimonas sediminis]AXR08072.1 chemoreceptor glutamine deamidase CheD [Salinimonas sediminis]